MDHAISLLARFSGNVGELRELVNTLALRVDRMEEAAPAVTTTRKRARVRGDGEGEGMDEDEDEGDEDDFQLGVAYATFYNGQHVPPPSQQSWPNLVEALNVELARRKKAMEENLWAKHQAKGQVNALTQERDAISTQMVEYRNRVEYEQKLASRAREEAASAREAVDAMRKKLDEADQQRALDDREKERELQRLRRECDGHDTAMAKIREEMSRDSMKAMHQYNTDIQAARERTIRHDAYKDKRISELEREIARLRMIAAIGVTPPQPTQPPIVAPRPPQQQQQYHPAAAAVDMGEEIDLRALDFDQLRQETIMPDSPTYTPSTATAYRPGEQ